MTGFLRSSARNPFAIAIMGALILVFLVLGVGGGSFPDAFRSMNANAVVSVGSHSLDAKAFEKIWDGQKKKLEQQNGQQLTNLVLVQNGVDTQILDQIGLEQAGLELLRKEGIIPATSLVANEIKKLPWAFDPVTGQFSQTQFVQALAQQGLTPREAQQQITDDLAVRHFEFAAAAGLRAPMIYAAITAAQGTEDHDVSYFVMGLNAVPAPAPPTDAQLQTFMNAHAAQLMLPERRTFTLVRFSAKAIGPTIKVTPAQVAQAFAARKDSLSTPETRTVVEIPVKTAAEGAAAAQKLQQGEAPNAIAKSLGVDAVTYDNKPASAIADQKVAQAAFGLAAGAVAGPVSGDLGLAAIKVVKVTPGHVETLAEATPRIEADLRQKAAADQAYQQSTAFDNARQTGAGVVDAAKKVGAQTVAIGPVTAQGLDADGKPNPLLTPGILKDAFSQPAGQDGDLEDVGSGEYFALKVDSILPPALPSLADKRPELTRAYMTSTLVAALKAKAQALIALSKKNGSLGAAAAQVGAKVVQVKGLEEIKAQQYQALGDQFLEGVFGAKVGDVFGAGGHDGIYIARLDATRPGDPHMTAQVTAALRGRVSQAYASDLLDAVQSAAKARNKVSLNLALARQTLGVPVNAGPGGPAKGSKPAK